MSVSAQALRRDGLPRHGEARTVPVAVETAVPSLKAGAVIFRAGTIVQERYCGHCLAWFPDPHRAIVCPRCFTLMHITSS